MPPMRSAVAKPRHVDRSERGVWLRGGSHRRKRDNAHQAGAEPVWSFPRKSCRQVHRSPGAGQLRFTRPEFFCHVKIVLRPNASCSLVPLPRIKSPFPMITRSSFVVAFLFSASLAALRAADPAEPAKIDLWPEGVPGLHADETPEKLDATHASNVHHPYLVAFPAPADKAVGTAVIICPGGQLSQPLDRQRGLAHRPAPQRHWYLRLRAALSHGRIRAPRPAARRPPRHPLAAFARRRARSQARSHRHRRRLRRRAPRRQRRHALRRSRRQDRCRARQGQARVPISPACSIRSSR